MLFLSAITGFVTFTIGLALYKYVEVSTREGLGSASNWGPHKEAAEYVTALRAALESLGGRARYQEASMLLTQQHTGSSRWVFQQVTALGLRPGKGGAPLRTLEVGAVNAQLLSCPFLDVTAIDLKSRHPRIVERDFFDFDCPPASLFDVLSNAMVINCVPTAQQRGEMLVAVCVPEPGADLSLDAITAHLAAAGLARQKFPERLELLDALPMNAAGKIRKVDLRAMFAARPLLSTSTGGPDGV